MDNNRKTGRTPWDFLTYLYEKHGAWLLLIVVLAFVVLWGISHWQTPNGETVRLFTIPLYKKGTIEEPKGCQLKIRGALDDHYNSNSQYELLIKLNGQLKWRGNASKEFLHGRPYGKPFENWRTLSFDVPAYELRESKPIIKFEHRSSSENDWIAIDYMEVVCENGSQRTELSGYKGYGEEDEETGIIYGGKTEAWPLEVNQLLGK